MLKPDDRNNTQDTGIFNAQDLIRWKGQHGMLKIPTPPSKVIISPQLKIIRSKKKRFSQKEIKGLVGMHLCVDSKSGVYLSGGWGIGGPAMVAVCEELHALGATEFYLLGMCGRLSDIKEGELAIASSAIREEGTSDHYLPKDFGAEVASPDTDKILNLSDQFFCKQTKFISTDAPYRETIDKYSDWCKKGAELIDMETASLYAFGRFHNISAISIGVGADSLMGGKWEMAKNYNAVEKKVSTTIDDLIEIIK